MESPEQNQLLTEVGRGTPMGELMRRYWQPIGAAVELEDKWTQRVRLLGEDLVLFRNRQGQLGLIADLGPHPRPLLPRFDGFVAEGTIRMMGRALLPINWLQIMENSLDPVHTEWLHGHHYEFQKEQEGIKVAISAPHEKIDFREFEFGITKHRLLAGHSEDSDDWRTGHPILFPNILAVGNGDEAARYYSFQMRVPVDNEHTMHLWFNAYVPPKGITVPERLTATVHTYEVPFMDASGEFIVDNVDGQDMMAWISQGAIADRTLENLGASDRGIAMY